MIQGKWAFFCEVVFKCWMHHHLESILAMKDVGIQVRTVYWGGRTVSRFIDRRKIHDIIINEGITMWQIKSYMAIIVKNQEHMIVVFEVGLKLKTRVMIRV